jgi:hypothetical protein
MKRPDTLQDVVQAWSLDVRAYSTAIAGFLDSFYVNPERRQAMIDPEPDATGNAEIDAYLGAVAEHLARRWRLRIPAWTQKPCRFLRQPLFATSIESLKALLLAQSPLSFRKRMIFVEHEPLRRARMQRADQSPDAAA